MLTTMAARDTVQIPTLVATNTLPDKRNLESSTHTQSYVQQHRARPRHYTPHSGNLNILLVTQTRPTRRSRPHRTHPHLYLLLHCGAWLVLLPNLPYSEESEEEEQ